MWFELKRRTEVSKKTTLIMAILAILGSLALFTILFWYEGIGFLTGYKEMFTYAFAPSQALSLTIRRTIPFLLLTLAFIVPLKAGIWNIGAQGQFYMGATAATGLSFAFSNQPSYILIPILMGGAMIAGAGWAGIAGFLKGKLKVNEIITTLMLNWVAIFIVKHLVEGGPWMTEAGRPESSLLSPAGAMPNLVEFGGKAIPYTIILAIGLAVALFFFFRRSRLGFEIKTVGENPATAESSGMSYAKVVLVTMLIGGALAGIAGYHQSANVVQRLRPDLSPQWGFYAIVIGLLVNRNSLGAIVGSFFVCGFIVGTSALQMFLGMTYGAGPIFIGILFLLFAAFRFFQNYKIVWTRGEL